MRSSVCDALYEALSIRLSSPVTCFTLSAIHSFTLSVIHSGCFYFVSELQSLRLNGHMLYLVIYKVLQSHTQ